MPVWLVRLGKIVLSTLGIVGGGWLINELLVDNSNAPFPDPVTSFDWGGLLTILAIAGGVALITWLILRRK